MRRPLLLALVALSALAGSGQALAHPPGDPSADRCGGDCERLHERMRTLRSIALTEALDLDEETSLRMNATMREFDAQRQALRAKAQPAMRLIHRAAGGRAVSDEALSEAIETLLTHREALAALDQAEARALLKGLDPQRQAKLMVFLRRFPMKMKKMMRALRSKGAEPGRSPPPDAASRP